MLYWGTMSIVKRIGIGTAAAVMVGVLALGGFSLGFEAGRKVPETIIVEGVDGINATSTSADFGTFWQAWQEINEGYLRAADVPADKKVEGAIQGLVGALNDPYSQYFSPDEAKSFLEDVEGNFSGIGAEIGIRKEQLVVISPIKDSPAFRAGLKPSDQILLIDATSTEGMSVDRAVSHIRGKEGTPVKLTIYREGWEKPKEMEIVRRVIVVPTVTMTMLPGGVAHVELYSFNANANQAFFTAIRSAARQGVKGVVLDLRGNPGGYLEVAVDLAGWFMPKGKIVVQEAGRGGTIQEVLRSDGNGALAGLPVVVLIDEGSASASEILAGALRDQRKARLVGEQSFGKGTVQQFAELRDGSVLKLTIANWLLPSGDVIEGKGLAPDYEVPLTEEDIKNNKDPQLDKALEVIRSEIKR